MKLTYRVEQSSGLTDITKYLLDFSIESNLSDIYINLMFSLPHNKVKEFNVQEGGQINFETEGFKFEGIILKYTDEDNVTGRFSCVSLGWYLTVHEETFQIDSFANSGIKEVIKSYDRGFKLKDIVISGFDKLKIKKIYYEMSLESIVKDIIEQVVATGNEKYYIIDNNGEIEVIKSLGFIQLDIGTMRDLKRNFDISKIKNRVKACYIKDKTLTKFSAVQEEESIKKIGTIQKVLAVKSNNSAEAKSKAENLLSILSRRFKEISFTLKGDWKIKIGYLVKLKGENYLIKSVKHTIKDGIFSTELSMEVFYGS